MGPCNTRRSWRRGAHGGAPETEAPTEVADPKQPVELRRRREDEVAIPAKNLSRAIQFIENRAADDRRHGMELEKERGHDPEVAATSTDRPEEIRMALSIGRDQLSRCKYDICLEQAVDRQAVAATQIADAAAEGQAGDSGGPEDACREREAEGMGRVIDVG